jgi:hypothetical protein
MQTISDGLRAAAQGGGAPAVSARVYDPQHRWTTLHALGETSAARCDLCASSGGPLGDVIVRARINPAGHAEALYVSDPRAGSQWIDWDAAGPDAAVPGDVALAAPAARIVRLFYVSTGNGVYLCESEDQGAFFGAATLILAGGAQAPRLAAAHELLVVQDTTVRAYKKAHGGASWSGPVTLPGLTLSDWRGVGLAYDAASDGYILLFCGDGRVGGCRYDNATDTWGAVEWLGPGGEQRPPDAAAPHSPNVIVGADRYLATWIEQYQGGTPAWEQPLARCSRDGAHWGLETALAAPAATHQRLGLVRDDANACIYAANELVVLRSDDRAACGQGGAGPLAVTGYTRWSRHDGAGTLRLEALDAEGRYRHLGVAGTDGEMVKPLAMVIVERGYTVAGAEERVALEPFWLVEATRSEGASGGRLVIDAVDGWGLLGRWRPAEPLQWEGRSVAWLLATLCARVGLGYGDDGAAAWDTVLPRYSLAPTTSAAQAVRDLLRLAGGAARFGPCNALQACNVLQAIHLASHAPTPLDVGDQGEILQAAYGPACPDVTTWRVLGEGVAAVDDDVAASMALGLRLTGSLLDRRVTDQALAEQVLAGLAARVALSGRADVVTVPLRPEVEVWDAVTLHGAGVDASDAERMVLGIEERWRASAGTFESWLLLG